MKKLGMFCLAFLLVLSGMTFNVNLDSFVNNEKPLEFKTQVYATGDYGDEEGEPTPPPPPPPPPSYYARIKLEKTVSPTKAKVGDIVEYTLIVKNTGDYTLCNVTITDSILGELDEFKLGTLTIGESKTVNVRYITPLGASGQLENTATVTGKNGSLKVSDTDSAVLEIITPAIGMVKLVNKTLVEPGETVDYTFIIANIGNVELEKVVVTDPLFGEEWKYEIGNLKVGEHLNFTQSYTVTEDASGNIENIAIATGSHEDTTVRAIGKENIDILVPPEPEEPEEPEEPLPDLPHTGGPVEPEILFAGMGGLLLLIGKMLRNKK